MARREVTHDEVSFDGKFLKFSELFPEVGSTFRGIYQSDAAGQYGQDFKFVLSRGDVARFGIESGNIGIVTAKGPLKSQLVKLAPEKGELVTITRGQDKGGFFTFAVAADAGPKGAAPAAPKVAASEDF